MLCPGSSGCALVSPPVMTRSPGSSACPRPASCSASHTTPRAGCPLAAAPVPRSTTSPSTDSSTGSAARSDKRHHRPDLRLDAGLQRPGGQHRGRAEQHGVGQRPEVRRLDAHLRPHHRRGVAELPPGQPLTVGQPQRGHLVLDPVRVGQRQPGRTGERHVQRATRPPGRTQRPGRRRMIQSAAHAGGPSWRACSRRICDQLRAGATAGRATCGRPPAITTGYRRSE